MRQSASHCVAGIEHSHLICEGDSSVAGHVKEILAGCAAAGGTDATQKAKAQMAMALTTNLCAMDARALMLTVRVRLRLTSPAPPGEGH